MDTQIKKATKINIGAIADSLHAYSSYEQIADFIYEENKELISKKWNLHTKEEFYTYNKTTINERLERDITEWFVIKISKMPEDKQLEISRVKRLEDLQ